MEMHFNTRCKQGLSVNRLLVIQLLFIFYPVQVFR